MRYQKFSVRIPESLIQALDAAAFSRFKRNGMRTQMLIDILYDQLALAGDGEAPTPIITHNNQDATIKVKRKRATV
jgi:hypothetical protein